MAARAWWQPSRLTINPVNDLPIAVNDSYVVDEGGLLLANDRNGTVPGTNNDGVLVNDSDAEREVLTVVLIAAPAACGRVHAECGRHVQLSA